MSKLEADMAFEIGDLVYFKTAMNCGSEVPKAFMITERLVQECHGGVQRNYLVHPRTESLFVPEILLTKEMPQFDAASELGREQKRELELEALWREWKEQKGRAAE